jgi:hypothetical protein
MPPPQRPSVSCDRPTAYQNWTFYTNDDYGRQVPVTTNTPQPAHVAWADSDLSTTPDTDLLPTLNAAPFVGRSGAAYVDPKDDMYAAPAVPIRTQASRNINALVSAATPDRNAGQDDDLQVIRTTAIAGAQHQGPNDSHDFLSRSLEPMISTKDYRIGPRQRAASANQSLFWQAQLGEDSYSSLLVSDDESQGASRGGDLNQKEPSMRVINGGQDWYEDWYFPRCRNERNPETSAFCLTCFARSRPPH